LEQLKSSKIKCNNNKLFSKNLKISQLTMHIKERNKKIKNKYSSCETTPLSNLPFQQKFFFNYWKIARNTVFCLPCFFLYKQLARHLMDLQEDCKRAKPAIKRRI
jgi:hypothetical protein